MLEVCNIEFSLVSLILCCESCDTLLRIFLLYLNIEIHGTCTYVIMNKFSMSRTCLNCI